MTQAFNLSQLANRVNTSGQLNAATGLFNQTPVANGGTGRSSVTSGALLLGAGTSALTELAGTTPGSVLATSPTGWAATPAASVGGGNYVLNAYTSPATWLKPGTLKAIKVTVVGQGGAGGSTGNPSITAGSGGGGGGSAIAYIPAPSIPGPVAVTAGGGTNSFGAFCSATAGGAGAFAPGASAGGTGGVGSGGQVNIGGGGGNVGGSIFGNPVQPGFGMSGAGGSSILGGGGAARSTTVGPGNPGRNFGGGGGGSVGGPANSGGTGAPGVVIVEEFY